MPNAPDFGALREKLVQERSELAQDIRGLEQATEELSSDRAGGARGISNHMAEGASSTFEQERNLALLGNLHRTMGLIESALRRLEAGSYGLCQVCGKKIDRARLEALPYAAHCVSCQAKLEKG